MSSSDVILSLKNVSVHYGAIQALTGISFDLYKGEILSVIGCNGAGKSTTLRAISGLRKPSEGQIVYKGENIAGMAPHLIVRKRLVQAPEGRGIFLNLSIEENLDLGAWSAPSKATFKDDLEHVYSLFPRLKERRTQSAGRLGFVSQVV